MIKDLGKRIKELRLSKNLSQQYLADKLGYDSRSSINKIEVGKNDVPFGKVNEIAKALDVTLLELIGIDEPNVQFNTTGAIEDSKKVNQLVIKCNGVISKVFINGQEIEGLVGIKFSHKTEELAELELSTIVIPNGETLF